MRTTRVWRKEDEDEEDLCSHCRIRFTADVGLSRESREHDVPIKPGETVLLKLARQDWTGVRAYLRSHNFPEVEVRRIRLRIDEPCFGDGSGYRLGSVPFYPRTSSLRNYAPESPNRYDQTSAHVVPASYVPTQSFGCEGQPRTRCGLMDVISDNLCLGSCAEHH
jgi:hypothetical protein